MIENFPKIMSDTKSQIQEVQRTSRRINAKSQKPKHIYVYHFQTTENQR